MITAYHEAGHAVAAYRLGRCGNKVSIIPDESIEAAGSYHLDDEWMNRLDDIEKIVCFYAGDASAKKIHPNAPDSFFWGAGDDDERAAEWLNCIEETEADLRQRAKVLVEENWPVIQIVAEKLLEHETLDPDLWTILIDAYDEGDDPDQFFIEMQKRKNELGRGFQGNSTHT
jgi:hypothetical protein